MSRQSRHIRPFRADKIFLGLLACAYVGYLITFGHLLLPAVFAPANSITKHAVDTPTNVAIQHWTVSSMRHAVDGDQQDSNNPSLTPQSTDEIQGKASMQQGQPPRTGNQSYPISTVGKVFFTNDAGQNMTCSGTAITSLNSSVVDTAGHCIYQIGEWMQNVIFCPLYDNGTTPYGCWAARGLEVPSDWINAKPNDYHHDFGMLIVASNSQGLLTDIVGGVGWAYNQSVKQPFYAYGYPAGYPFDGQTRQSCESTSGTVWQHGEGNAVSIPCNMNGGSSGGPWLIEINNNWYLNGHNDFITGIKPGHMFSPYYDDTWYALYDQAQHA
jgi:V8-like Glu-specific endopeptidase